MPRRVFLGTAGLALADLLLLRQAGASGQKKGTPYAEDVEFLLAKGLPGEHVAYHPPS